MSASFPGAFAHHLEELRLPSACCCIVHGGMMFVLWIAWAIYLNTGPIHQADDHIWTFWIGCDLMSCTKILQ